ncbi:MAG: ubiquitin-protein ligase molybdopterin-converting factor, partial [Olpidium bornovanus]
MFVMTPFGAVSFGRIADHVERALSHPRATYVLTAAAASAVTFAAIMGTQAMRRRRRARRLKREVLSAAAVNLPRTLSATFTTNNLQGAAGPTGERSSSPSSSPTAGSAPVLPAEEEDLAREQLSRNISFLGEEGVRRIRDSFVVVVGCGGVGSWAALMLLRSGVERLRFIDFDQVTLSSLNRHAVATRADVGMPKVIALKRHLKEIVPHAVIDARVDVFRLNAAETLLDDGMLNSIDFPPAASGNPSYVLDCIDNIKTKLELLKYCHDRKLPVISSMGAGAKADPSRVQISDISETMEDPLARTTRRSLRKVGVESGIAVVYSTEKPGKVGLVDLDDSQLDQPQDFAALPSFRVRILPVLGTLPAIFGMSMASYVILKLAQFPVEPLPIKLRDALYARLLRDARVREELTFKEKDIPWAERPIGFDRKDGHHPMGPSGDVKRQELCSPDEDRGKPARH